jgi:hypothetical protein
MSLTHFFLHRLDLLSGVVAERALTTGHVNKPVALRSRRREHSEDQGRNSSQHTIVLPMMRSMKHANGHKVSQKDFLTMFHSSALG